MELKTVDLAGPCVYADYGGEGRPLVLVHGLAGSHVNWMLVGPKLAETHRVLALDLVGFGLTPLAGRRSTVEMNLGLISRFIEDVAGPPALVIGHSMGGLLTLLLCAARPDLVQAAVLMDAASPGADAHPVAPETEALLDSLAGDPEAGATVAHQFTASLGAEQLVDQAFAWMHARPVDPLVRKAHIALEARRGETVEGSLAYLQAYADLSGRRGDFDTFDSAVRDVKAPILVIHGEQDPVVPIENMRRAAALRPDWETVWLPEVGHNPQMEAPDEFLLAVVPFLERAVAAVGA